MECVSECKGQEEQIKQPLLTVVPHSRLLPHRETQSMSVMGTISHVANPPDTC